MTKVITFDLGNVLYMFDPRKAAAGLLRLTNGVRNAHDILSFFRESPIEKAYCEGMVSSREFFEHVKTGLQLQCTFAEFCQIYCEIFSLNVPVLQIIKKLKKGGYPIFLLSNTNELHFEYLAAQGNWTSFFDGMILSYKVQCQKPQEKIYRILLDTARCFPQELFFTDDFVENVDAARGVGIDAYTFVDSRALTVELTKRGISW